MRIRSERAAAGLVAFAACLSGCGGGDGTGSATTAATGATAPPAVARTEPVKPVPSTPSTSPAKPPPTTATTATTPGGGGEEPARTELVFSASSSGISPKQGSVAPYIAVRITLESKDGSSHKLVVSGKTLSVGGTRKSAFVELPGLPPGRSYSGRADGRTSIRILSSSEPGP